MQQKILGQIDSSYRAQSHSLETLKDWHYQHSHVSEIVLSSQVLFPTSVSVFLTLYFFYVVQCEPNRLGKRLDMLIASKSITSAEGKCKLWIIATLSILFTVGTIVADGFALGEYRQLPKEIEQYINDDSRAFGYLRAIPITMLVFDLLSVVIFVLIPVIVMCCKRCECCRFNSKHSDFLYTLLSPLTCIATHSYHIIFAFINNPYHATSVLLFYIMTLFAVVAILQKIYYFIINLFKWKGCTHKHITQSCCVFIFYILAITTIAGSIALTIALLILLPLNNAIDQASNQIYAIYQASVTVFAALVTFQVFFRDTNSFFGLLIKAGDTVDHALASTENWEDMSARDKEIYLGRTILSHINFTKPDKQEQPTQSGEHLGGFCCAACCVLPTKKARGYSQHAIEEHEMK